ncbi:uncharacterized protein [Palaemon carinicauda]|uniref:uncharacterized protein n=1 Tax=Palaemon carinicauda TaxID=392227 RepID=UPI0035B61869
MALSHTEDTYALQSLQDLYSSDTEDWKRTQRLSCNKLRNCKILNLLSSLLFCLVWYTVIGIHMTEVQMTCRAQQKVLGNLRRRRNDVQTLFFPKLRNCLLSST